MLIHIKEAAQDLYTISHTFKYPSGLKYIWNKFKTKVYITKMSKSTFIPPHRIICSIFSQTTTVLQDYFNLLLTEWSDKIHTQFIMIYITIMLNILLSTIQQIPAHIYNIYVSNIHNILKSFVVLEVFTQSTLIIHNYSVQGRIDNYV